MAKPRHIKHQFIEYIPNALDPETLYISVKYATSTHLCLCGCGERVVAPLAPTEWRLTFDGDTVSLDPSIGNWSFDCQSHYWIRRNRVIWAGRWSKKKIEANRSSDHHRKRAYYDDSGLDQLERDRVRDGKGRLTRLPSWLRRGR
jgi:hypothetical protein